MGRIAASHAWQGEEFDWRYRLSSPPINRLGLPTSLDRHERVGVALHVLSACPICLSYLPLSALSYLPLKLGPTIYGIHIRRVGIGSANSARCGLWRPMESRKNTGHSASA
jgi:hypothetical protein